MNIIKHGAADVLQHPAYHTEELERLAQVSSVGEHLWIGEKHHLDKRAVRKLIKHLQHWCETGGLDLKEPS